MHLPLPLLLLGTSNKFGLVWMTVAWMTSYTTPVFP